MGAHWGEPSSAALSAGAVERKATGYWAWKWEITKGLGDRENASSKRAVRSTSGPPRVMHTGTVPRRPPRNPSMKASATP